MQRYGSRPKIQYQTLPGAGIGFARRISKHGKSTRSTWRRGHSRRPKRYLELLKSFDGIQRRPIAGAIWRKRCWNPDNWKLPDIRWGQPLLWLRIRRLSCCARQISSFGSDDIPRAIHFSQEILGQIPDFDTIVFGNFDRFGLPVDTILRQGLPADRRATRSYFSHLLSTNRVTDTELTWAWLVAHGYTDDPIAGAYETFLLRDKAYDEAARSWVDYLGNRRGDLYRINRIFNGDFENPPTGSPLDWQIGQVEGAQIARDSDSVHSGKFSLHIRFLGTHNVALEQVSQSAIVVPGSYRLEYFIKTDAMTTDEGVRLRVFDPTNAAMLDVLSEPVTGTNPWRLEVTKFTVKPQTHMVQVQVVRNVSQKFDNKIGGSAWIDGIKIEPVSP